MIALPPLVIADMTVVPSKGGRLPTKEHERQISACEVLLPSLVASGFTVPALCELLSLAEEELRTMLDIRALPATGARGLRKSTTSGAWTVIQMQYLLVLWTTNLFATGIAAYIGRSAGSVRYKAKALGLPRRDRMALIGKVPRLLPPLLPPTHRPWSWTDKKNLGEMQLRGVSTAVCAALLRRDFRATECEAGSIELPSRTFMRGRLKTVYRPEEPRLAQYTTWVFRECIQSAIWFWGSKDGSRISKRCKRSKRYQNLVGGLDEMTMGGY